MIITHIIDLNKPLENNHMRTHPHNMQLLYFLSTF